VQRTITKWFIRISIALMPVGVAFTFDRHLKSFVHPPIIGVCGVLVALCDALFGQIIAQTQWMPLSGNHTPAHAISFVENFERYHRNIFFAWVITKLSSGLSIALSAITAIARDRESEYYGSLSVILVGYLALGVAISGAIYFLSTYFQARNANNAAKLEEIRINYEQNMYNQRQNALLDDEKLKQMTSVYNESPQPINSVTSK